MMSEISLPTSRRVPVSALDPRVARSNQRLESLAATSVTTTMTRTRRPEATVSSIGPDHAAGRGGETGGT